MEKPHILLFDLYSTGHHPLYVKYLADFWVRNRIEGALEIHVAPYFVYRNADLVSWIRERSSSGLSISETDDVDLQVKPRFHPFTSSLLHGKALRRAIKKRHPSHVLLMYFDHVQLPLAYDLHLDNRVPMAGIFFRAAFHYSQAYGYAEDIRSRLCNLSKRALLKLAGRNPNLETLFLLDPYGVDSVRDLVPDVRVQYVPDPISEIPVPRAVESAREKQRKTRFLFFGTISAAKGLDTLIEALLLLHKDTQRSIELVVAGEVEQDYRETAASLIARLSRESDVAVDARLVRQSEEGFPGFFSVCDVVLLPYQQHIGMSNILLIATAYGKPVISSDFGLLGRLVLDHRLGLTVNASSPSELSNAINRALTEPLELWYNAKAAEAFVTEHTTDRFAETIFRALVPELRLADASQN